MHRHTSGGLPEDVERALNEMADQVASLRTRAAGLVRMEPERARHMFRQADELETALIDQLSRLTSRYL
jgi:hypothetical protein